MDLSLSYLYYSLLLTIMLSNATRIRTECDPTNPYTVPTHDPYTKHWPGVYYGGNFICGLTCRGYCDRSPAWKPYLGNAFKCQCPVEVGCNQNGPITYNEDIVCRKYKSGNCNFQPNPFQPSDLTYDCYRCSMRLNEMSHYYACCPIVEVKK